MRPILLAEDSPDDAELTTRALRANHVTNDIVWAHDGVEALDYIFCRGAYEGRNIHDTPLVTLLDLNMPRVDGLQVLKEVRANPVTCMMPMVVLTSSREERDLVQSYNFGVNSYVRKPVDFSQFIEAARQLSLYWLMLNEPPPVQRS